MNELNDILTASSPLLIAIAMTIFGKVLKLSPIPDRLIPLLLCFTGMVGYAGMEGWTCRNAITGFTVAGLAAVGANQLWRKSIVEIEEPKP